jgi:hypothetical protein
MVLNQLIYTVPLFKLIYPNTITLFKLIYSNTITLFKLIYPNTITPLVVLPFSIARLYLFIPSREPGPLIILILAYSIKNVVMYLST